MSNLEPPDPHRAVDETPEQAELEQLLLRSARLDRGGARAEQRALESGTSELNRGSRAVSTTTFAVGVGLALAAAAALFLSARGEHDEREVAPEPVRMAAAPRPSAAPPVAACPQLVVARGDAPLLEDWETKDSRVLPRDGRAGSWATYDDGTGKQTPPDKSPLFPSHIPGGRGTSQSALHLFGGKFTNWGVTFGAELASAACYDASRYAGVEFWARGSGKLKVGFQMIDVQDVRYGGLCKVDCYNTHRKVVELKKSFGHYTVRWEELHQLYEAGPPLAFDPRRVRMLEFGIGPESTPFDIWVDDVAFLAH